MRRITLIAAVLTLGLAGAADSRPWLGMHRGLQAIRSSLERYERLGRCRRLSATHISCHITTTRPSRAFGETWDAGSTYTVGAELSRGRIAVYIFD